MPMDRKLESGREVVLGIRPEHLEIAADGFEVEVVVIEPTGSETQLFARVGGQEIAAVFRERHEFSPGTCIRLRPRADCMHLFDPSSGQRI
jgi:multiple sugar transport system ATP-binding protein